MQDDKKKQASYLWVGFTALMLVMTGAMINSFIEWRGDTTLKLLELEANQVRLEAEMETASDTLEDVARALNRNTELVTRLVAWSQTQPSTEPSSAQEPVPDPEETGPDEETNGE